MFRQQRSRLYRRPLKVAGAYIPDSQSTLLRLVQGHLSKVTGATWWGRGPASLREPLLTECWAGRGAAQVTFSAL